MRISFPTGQFSSIYRAEAKALEHALSYAESNIQAKSNVVFLTDSSTVLQNLKDGDKILNNLLSTLNSCSEKHSVVLQWIPSHCDVQGNEVADKLAKEGAKYQQIDFSTNFDEEKNFIKIKYKLKWDQQHPSYNKRDPYYDLTRRQQVVICRLRSNHNRLKHLMFNKFKIGQSVHVVGETRLQVTFCNTALCLTT